MIDGLIYVFDRSTGEPAWKRPAEVRDQPMLSQPVDAPAIAFVGNVARRNSRGSQQRVSLLLLEKASGRLLFRDENLPSSLSNYCSMKASRPGENPEVVLETSSQIIRLEFTTRTSCDCRRRIRGEARPERADRNRQEAHWRCRALTKFDRKGFLPRIEHG